MPDSRDGAVLMVDIAGSTSLRSSLGDETAGLQLNELLRSMMESISRRGGTIVKSDGDDLLVTFEDHGATDAAAHCAVECQELALDAGLALYAGLSTGTFRHTQVLGRPDVEGLCINVAARLHKLIPNEPGYVFVDGASVARLSDHERRKCRSFGDRDLKGIGRVQVFSLDWNDQRTSPATAWTMSTEGVDAFDLSLAVGAKREVFAPARGKIALGRSSRCQVVMTSEIVSSRHAEFSCDAGIWSVRDISRNGTWARLDGAMGDLHLVGTSVALTRRGQICLGQSFESDGGRATTVAFELTAR